MIASASASRSPSPAALVHSPGQMVPGAINTPEALQDLFESASELLNEDKYTDALARLKPHTQAPMAKGHYGFYSRLGTAYSGIAETLAAACSLGACRALPDASGNWLNPTLQIELLSCHVGVVGAYGQLLQLLQNPQQRANLIEKNGLQTLDVIEQGAKESLEASVFSAEQIIRRIFDANSTKILLGELDSVFVIGTQDEIVHRLATPNDHPFANGSTNAAIASQGPTRGLQIVLNIRERLKDPCFDAIAELTAPIYQAALLQADSPKLFWAKWLRAEKFNLMSSEAFRAAAPFSQTYQDLLHRDDILRQDLDRLQSLHDGMNALRTSQTGALDSGSQGSPLVAESSEAPLS